MGIDKSVAVGVEVTVSGATVALVDCHGRVHHRLYAKTLRGRPAAATLEPYLRCIEQMLGYALAEGFDVRGLGISVPGTLDHGSRRPLLIPTLPALNGIPLCDLLETRFELPTHLHVDVDAALLGEYRFGVGKGLRRLLFLTVNAVVGAAFIVDGKIEQPAQQYTGHVCHIPVATNGLRCSCGKRGCINTLVSIDAMQRMVLRALRRGEETSLASRLSNGEYFSPQLLAEEAARGDSVALQVYSEMGRWLGAVSAIYIDTFTPDTLILGGGVLGANELLLQQVRKTLMTHLSTEEYNKVEVVSAHLGSDAVLVGVVAPLFVGDTLQHSRQAVPLADVVPGDRDDQPSSIEDVLDGAYLAGADVVRPPVQQSRSKNYQRRAG
jgi:glucokinase